MKRAPFGKVNVRVDREVYGLIVEEKARSEVEARRPVSMGAALRRLLVRRGVMAR